MNMLSGLINTNERTLVSVEQIKADGGTQMRAGLDDATVTEYADFFRESRQWGDFPPVVLYHDGADYWLADGFHRVAAWKRAGNALMGATKIPADVRSGTRRDAILYAAGANANHGLRRTNADKRRSVEVLLRDEEWSKWSDREIGRKCQVSDVFVGKMRKELSANGLQMATERTVQRDGMTYTQNTANIGANRPAAQSPGRRYESGLPALNMPSPRPTIGAQPKMPITDWELSDICETVANELFGDISRGRVVGVTNTMISDAYAQNGPYWLKLLRTLAPFDAPLSRIQAAVADAAKRMVAERGAADAEPEASATAPAVKPPMTPEAKELSREIKMPDDLVDVWSPRFDGAGVYLVDVERNRSTETVALDDIAEPFAQARRMDGALDAEKEALTAADMQVMQAPRVTLVALTATTLADVLRPVVTEFYEDGSDTWQQWAAREMRLIAGKRDDEIAGGFWRRCIATLDASHHRQHSDWTTGLLRQALGMLADELAAPTPLTPPIEPPIAVPLKPAPDDRVGKMARLIAGYQATISTFDEYGELIGAHLETQPAKRELEKLIKHLRREIDLLEGKVVEEAWG